ncbi:MAG TPA: hypothetical protein VEU29_02660, partial [Actinomycetota bacterium]|nr:hypothetical protein [Actinomycetota bacterium]
MKTVDVAGTGLAREPTDEPALQRLATSVAGHCDPALVVTYLAEGRLVGYSVVAAKPPEAHAVARHARARAASLGATF